LEFHFALNTTCLAMNRLGFKGDKLSDLNQVKKQKHREETKPKCFIAGVGHSFFRLIL
jgi:hypothetical protein